MSFQIREFDKRYLFLWALKEITERKYILLYLNEKDKIIFDKIQDIFRTCYFIYIIIHILLAENDNFLNAHLLLIGRRSFTQI